MNYLQKRWLNKNTTSLNGKTVALTGATGGLGKELCFYLAFLGAHLVLVNRNEEKALRLKQEILNKYKDTAITLLTANLENICDVEKICCELEDIGVEFIIHNAGAYAIKRRICSTGFVNVFQINFVSAAYMSNRLLPMLEKRNGKIVVVSSIAHNYSKTDADDIDFKGKKSDALCYGNSKRYLTYFHNEFLKNSKVSLSIVHPGITFTSITDHYPDWLFKIIKYPMQVIFMKRSTAALNILKGVFGNTNNEWYSPFLFGIWGTPVKRKLKTADKTEQKRIYEKGIEIINKISV